MGGISVEMSSTQLSTRSGPRIRNAVMETPSAPFQGPQQGDPVGAIG